MEEIENIRVKIATIEASIEKCLNGTYIYPNYATSNDQKMEIYKDFQSRLIALQDEELKLLEIQHSRQKENLYEYLSTVPTEFISSDELLLSKSITMSTSASIDFDPILFHFPNFDQHFATFKQLLRQFDERKYTPIDFDNLMMVQNNGNVKENLHYMLNNLFKQLLKEFDLAFRGRDNTEKIFSDMHISTKTSASIHHFIMEIKANLPQYSKTPKNQATIQNGKYVYSEIDGDYVRTYIDLVESYNNSEQYFDQTWKKNITKCVVKQMWTYSALINQKKPHEKINQDNLYYTMLTSNEVSFIFCQKDFSSLYVSPPIERKDLFFAVYFVLLLRYPSMVPGGAKETLGNFLNDIHNKLSSNYNESIQTRQQTNNPFNSPNTFSFYNTSGRGQTGGEKAPNFSSLDLFNYYMYDSELIFSNDNIRVAKFKHNHKWYVIKCCDLYKSGKEANDELKNEINNFPQIMDLVYKNKNNFQRQFVPNFVLGEKIMIYRMLVTDYINGECYYDFDCMSLEERKACEASLKQLHDLRVLHGDVRAPNFIIQNPKSQNPIAILIDFGRTRLDPTNEELRLEMLKFRKEAKLSVTNPRETESSGNLKNTTIATDN